MTLLKEIFIGNQIKLLKIDCIHFYQIKFYAINKNLFLLFRNIISYKKQNVLHTYQLSFREI